MRGPSNPLFSPPVLLLFPSLSLPLPFPFLLLALPLEVDPLKYS